jgi:hypothetical protein
MAAQLGFDAGTFDLDELLSLDLSADDEVQLSETGEGGQASPLCAGDSGSPEPQGISACVGRLRDIHDQESRGLQRSTA